jgi:hypothetical protein
MAAYDGDLQDFKVIYLDFAHLPNVCWIVRIPTPAEPDLCRIGVFDREHFLNAINIAVDSYLVTNRFNISDIVEDMLSSGSAHRFITSPIEYTSPSQERFVFDDFDSKVTLHTLYKANPSLHICVIEQVKSTYVEDYDRAMKIVS